MLAGCGSGELVATGDAPGGDDDSTSTTVPGSTTTGSVSTTIPGTSTTGTTWEESGTTTTSVLPPTQVTTPEGIVPPPTAPPAPPPPTSLRFGGTYAGVEHWSLSGQRCPDLTHHLETTWVLDDGRTLSHVADYCGVVHGDLWSGAGTFTLTGPTGTLAGSFESEAATTSSGEDYDLVIESGTGAFAGATGTCALTVQLLDSAFGTQEQSGTFSCRVVTSR